MGIDDVKPLCLPRSPEESPEMLISQVKKLLNNYGNDNLPSAWGAEIDNLQRYSPVSGEAYEDCSCSYCADDLPRLKELSAPDLGKDLNYSGKLSSHRGLSRQNG